MSRLRIATLTGASCAALTLAAASAASYAVSTLLPDGWRIARAENVLALGTLPQGLTLSPDGTKLAVVESGFAPARLVVLDSHSSQEIAAVSLPAGFGRPAWDSDSSGLWIGTGDANGVTHVALAGARADATVPLAPKGAAFYASDVARDPVNGTLAVSGESAGSVALVDPIHRSVIRTIAIDQPHTATASHPAELAWSLDGKRLYVALWGGDGVAEIDPSAGIVTARIHTGFHPEALALSRDGRTLYVANSDDDSVSAIDTASGVLTATLRIALFRTREYGLEPNDVFVDESSRRLYVTLADANAVAVIDTSGATLRQLGAIPTGWYPTGAVIAGSSLVVADGKGESSHANPAYNPYGVLGGGGLVGEPPERYIALNLIGALRRLSIPSDADLPALTAQVQRNAGPMLASPARPPRPLDLLERDGAKIVRANGPIRYVFFIIKENRTYDQVLGDDPRGDGDSTIAIFGRTITPNEHAIADRFGLFDRTFCDSHVSEDGHLWLTESFANDYVEKAWPPMYAGRRSEDDSAPYRTRAGYIWDDAARAHVTYRTYGEFTMPDPHRRGLYVGTIPSLAGHTDPYFPTFDLEILDRVRLAEWEREFRGYVVHRNLPQLETIWLMNDHTYGTRVGKRTPRAFVAENDFAVGRFVEDVSHSPYWRSSAIFIIEDDAQNGPDHVDEQRTTMYVVSPYSRGGLQHHHYTQSGLVRTIELILGLAPMSTFDAGADPLYAAFTTRPNFAPFRALAETYDRDEINTKSAYGAALSARLDFSHEDAADPAILNDVIMHSR